MAIAPMVTSHTSRTTTPHRRWTATAVLFGVVSVGLLIALPAAALQTGIEFGTGTGLSTQDIRLAVANIIRISLGILGIIALLIVLAGGALWMFSGGNEQQITKAKRLLANGAIGLTIILLAFSITQFVISRLVEATTGGGRVVTSGFADEVARLTGALGAGPIEGHLPARGATGVPRNIRIFVTFREEVDLASLAADTNGNGTIGTVGTDPTQFDNYRDLALAEAIQVAPVGANVDPTRLTSAARTADAAAFAREVAKLTPVGVGTVDRRTIVLTPVIVANGRVQTNAQGFANRALLGTDTAPTAYVVRVTSAIRKPPRTPGGTGDSLFPGAFREGYAWDFTVSTEVDATPPKVSIVVPTPDSSRDAPDGTVRGSPDQPRNVLLQIHFNEAVDPTTVTGAVPIVAPRTTPRLAVATAAGAAVAGTFTIGNAYRTVEFTTSAACGQNSCGGTVFCLPGDAELVTSAEAAQLESGGPSGIPFSGVMDAAGNSLDGNDNNRADGPGAPGTRRFTIGGAAAANIGASDSVEWRIFTTNTIDLTPPEVRVVVHYPKGSMTSLRYDQATRLQGVGNIAPDRPVEVLFSKLMSESASRGIHLSEASGCNVQDGQGCVWYQGTMRHEDTDDPDTAVDATRVTVDHGPFREARVGAAPQYRARIDSNVRDLYQNCFYTVGAPPGPRGPSGGERCTGAPETCAIIP